MNLVLASTSSYRRRLLERLRLPFTAEAPGVDEAAVKRSLRDPEAVVRDLARRKALAVAARHPEAIVIGSDQCASIDGDILDKPGTDLAAIAQLQRLQGREHELLTATALTHRGTLVEFLDRTRLRMRSLTAAEIERYVAAEQPLDCAGSYRIESLGIALFEHIECEDQTAIVGLPLRRLCEELRKLGVQLP
ncbi:MAG TPA: Maf family protein [Planctomycetota bacterium]